ncbi:hypothetical protein U1Q18_032720, partial [Sarracenia purpurea var. burkii]
VGDFPFSVQVWWTVWSDASSSVPKGSSCKFVSRFLMDVSLGSQSFVLSGFSSHAHPRGM